MFFSFLQHIESMVWLMFFSFLQRIEQIDTMEELFKELEAPPTTTQSTTTPASGVSPWASDLASLSQSMPQTQTQPMFTVGGTPFSTGQPFPPVSSAQNAFPGASPFGQPQGAAGQPFAQFGAGPQQPAAFGGQPNPFQVKMLECTSVAIKEW